MRTDASRVAGSHSEGGSGAEDARKILKAAYQSVKPNYFLAMTGQYNLYFTFVSFCEINWMYVRLGITSKSSKFHTTTIPKSQHVKLENFEPVVAKVIHFRYKNNDFGSTNEYNDLKIDAVVLN